MLLTKIILGCLCQQKQSVNDWVFNAQRGYEEFLYQIVQLGNGKLFNNAEDRRA